MVMRKLTLLAVPVTLVACWAPSAGPSYAGGGGWAGEVVIGEGRTAPSGGAVVDATPAGDAVAVWPGATHGWVARRAAGARRWGEPEPVAWLGSVRMVAARADGSVVVARVDDRAAAGLAVLEPDDTLVPAPLGQGAPTYDAYAKVDPVGTGTVGVAVGGDTIRAGFAAAGDPVGTWRSTVDLDTPHLASVTPPFAGDRFLVARDQLSGVAGVQVLEVSGDTGATRPAVTLDPGGAVVSFRLGAAPDGRAVLAVTWRDDAAWHVTTWRITPDGVGWTADHRTDLATHAPTRTDALGQPTVVPRSGGRATVVWTHGTTRRWHRVVMTASQRADGSWTSSRVLDRDATALYDAALQLSLDTVPATGATVLTWVDGGALVAARRPAGGGLDGFGTPYRLYAHYSHGDATAYGVGAVAADGSAWVLKVAPGERVKVRTHAPA